MDQQKLSIFSQLPQDLENYCQNLGMPKFRSKQLTNWLFTYFPSSPDQLTNLPADFRRQLAVDFDWSLPIVSSRLDSDDGASKLLLQGSKAQYFEAVILRYENRTSLCVSSQVGCKLACSFCQTGKLGFFRNLSSAEIIGQFVLANQILKAENRRITHIVFMGMGEPLDNFDAVVKACELFTHKEAYNLSPRRVTVSTSGIAPKILELAKAVSTSLALSLHASRDELRSELMPINKRYDLKELKASLHAFQKLTGDKITVEYILIKGKNCGLREAKELVKFLHGLRAKVNLIPFNSHPGVAFARPDDQEIRNFQKYLSDRGIPAPVRYSKGLDVSAACGQLAAKQKEALNDLPKRKNVVTASYSSI